MRSLISTVRSLQFRTVLEGEDQWVEGGNINIKWGEPGPPREVGLLWTNERWTSINYIHGFHSEEW